MGVELVILALAVIVVGRAEVVVLSFGEPGSADVESRGRRSRRRRRRRPGLGMSGREGRRRRKEASQAARVSFTASLIKKSQVSGRV